MNEEELARIERLYEIIMGEFDKMYGYISNQLSISDGLVDKYASDKRYTEAAAQKEFAQGIRFALQLMYGFLENIRLTTQYEMGEEDDTID